MKKVSERGTFSSSHATRAATQAMIVLVVPIIVTVSEVDVVHIVRVVAMLCARPVPVDVVGAASASMAIS